LFTMMNGPSPISKVGGKLHPRPLTQNNIPDLRLRPGSPRAT
jgi:hypothetical protein